jgi:hypothetical protein
LLVVRPPWTRNTKSENVVVKTVASAPKSFRISSAVRACDRRNSEEVGRPDRGSEPRVFRPPRRASERSEIFDFCALLFGMKYKDSLHWSMI